METTDLSEHSLNLSTSKQRYSFPKQPRFQQRNKLLCESFYDLPSTRTRRATALGYGQKQFGLSNVNTPSPCTYDLPSDINPEKRKYSAVSFGTGREKMEAGGPLGQVKHLGKLPSPTAYNNLPSRDFRAPALRSRLPDKEIERTAKNPGPGTYTHEEMGQAKYYISSRHRNFTNIKMSQVPRLSPITRKESVGPADYKPVDSINQIGRYSSSKHGSASSTVFSKSARKGLADATKAFVPGPGQYKSFSGFS